MHEGGSRNDGQKDINVSAEVELKDVISIETFAPCADSVSEERRPTEEKNAVKNFTQNNQYAWVNLFFFCPVVMLTVITVAAIRLPATSEKHLAEVPVNNLITPFFDVDHSIILRLVKWLSVAVLVKVACAVIILNAEKTIKKELLDRTCIILTDRLFKEFRKAGHDEAPEIVRKGVAPLGNDANGLSNLESNIVCKAQFEKAKKKDFLRDVLNIPDYILVSDSQHNTKYCHDVVLHRDAASLVSASDTEFAPCAVLVSNERRPTEEGKSVKILTWNNQQAWKNLGLVSLGLILILVIAAAIRLQATSEKRLTEVSVNNLITPFFDVDRGIILRLVKWLSVAFIVIVACAVIILNAEKCYLGGNVVCKAPFEKAKKDFLRDVLNIPDCTKPPRRLVEVHTALEQRGYEAEMTRLASFSKCPEQKQYPAVPLAENGFYFGKDFCVTCYFCKSKSQTWQRDWNPKMKHERDCPFLNNNDCGNIAMVLSRENGKYGPAIQSALEELQIQELGNKIQVLQRDTLRSLESFKKQQLPEYQMETLSITQETPGQGQQEHDAMEDEPQPSTSGSISSQQQQEGAGGLRYFVHSYNERGNPISTSQKMEFNSQEDRANTSMKKETDRLKTFDKVWKKGDVVSPKELAKSGFYYAGSGDRVRCAFCNGVLRNWAVGDRAAAEHRRHYPTCPFVLNLDVGNIPYSPDLSGLHTPTAATTRHTEQRRPATSTQGQQSAQSSAASFGAAITPSAVPGTILIPKHANFTTVDSRLLTYDNWPTTNVQRPQQLAEAGFFYTGSSDNVRCFHCDGGLRNWLNSDLPWVEHAKWFPRCGFLQRVTGVEFVLEETRKHNQQNFTTAVTQNRGSTGLTTTPVSTPGVGIVERPAAGGVRRVEAREVRARFDTESVKRLLDMGYKEAVVKYVILQRLRYTGDDFSSIQDMLESVLAEEPNLEEKGIAYYENILQQEFGRPMTIVYPQVTQMTGTLDKTAVPPPAPPMTQTTSASLPIPGDEKSLVEENRQLKEQTTCKICMDNEVSMVFVPCGHLVACADCAPNLRQCPICRRAITGTIRTFLS